MVDVAALVLEDEAEGLIVGRVHGEPRKVEGVEREPDRGERAGAGRETAARQHGGEREDVHGGPRNESGPPEGGPRAGLGVTPRPESREA